MIEGFSVSGGRSTCFEWAIWGISCGWLQPLGIGVQVAGISAAGLGKNIPAFYRTVHRGNIWCNHYYYDYVSNQYLFRIQI